MLILAIRGHLQPLPPAGRILYFSSAFASSENYRESASLDFVRKSARGCAPGEPQRFYRLYRNQGKWTRIRYLRE
jgi:hypothetical protein